MASRFIDFDSARAERAAEPLVLRAYGQDFELPAAMPAALLLDIVRLSEDEGPDAELSGQDAVRLMTMVVPADVLDALLERDDFSADDFIELAGLVVRAYTSGNGAASGEAPAPNRATRRHSAPAKSVRSRGSRASSTHLKAQADQPGPGPKSSRTGS